MRLEIILSRDEIEKQIPYAMICETRYGSVWDTVRRRRAWFQQFTEEERKSTSKLFQQAHNWYIVKGLPDEVQMNMSTKLLWDKLAMFCSSI